MSMHCDTITPVRLTAHPCDQASLQELTGFCMTKPQGWGLTEDCVEVMLTPDLYSSKPL